MSPGTRSRKGPLQHLHLHLQTSALTFASLSSPCRRLWSYKRCASLCSHSMLMKVWTFGAYSLQQNLFEMVACLTCSLSVIWHYCGLQKVGGIAKHPPSFLTSRWISSMLLFFFYHFHADVYVAKNTAGWTRQSALAQFILGWIRGHHKAVPALSVGPFPSLVNLLALWSVMVASDRSVGDLLRANLQ